jgi:cobalamin biosynthetic protein CobC
MLEHGGRLRQAARRHGIPLADWVDLSTGINPHPYPVPPLGPEVWQRLPEDDDGLEAAAAAYYGTPDGTPDGAAGLLPVAGSQAAIQTLPACFAPGQRVLTLAPTYAEHPHAWRAHALRALPADQIEAALDEADILLLVQPNNPDGVHFGAARLHAWHARLAARGGWLIVDEAFLDAEAEASLVPHTGAPGLVVLRSVGKFFGLAGARVGFVFGPPSLRSALAERLGPWPISGPARQVCKAALADRAWQAEARRTLQAASARLACLLDAHGIDGGHGTALFQWRPRPDAEALHHALARQGILTRLFTDPAGLRFGLPGTSEEWRRLEAALASL